jgi:hypothetical protein
VGVLDLSAGPTQAHQPSIAAPSANLLPSAVPSAMTPNVDDGAVWAIAQVGNTVVIGGTFTSVEGQPRSSLAAFDATTGTLSATFTPSTDGSVYSLLPGPNAHTVYVAGSFTRMNGTAAQFLTLLDTETGTRVGSFKPPEFDYGMVRDMVKVGSRLIVGGFFSKAGGRPHAGLASLNATTGALDPFVDIQLAGHHNNTGTGARGYVGSWALDASPDGKRLVVIGNFRTANGLPRDQLAMVDIGGAHASLDSNWATRRYAPYCHNKSFDGYVRGVSFSPDSSYFVVTATGGGVPGTLCDATARFETHAVGTNLQPTWVDETGGVHRGAQPLGQQPAGNRSGNARSRPQARHGGARSGQRPPVLLEPGTQSVGQGRLQLPRHRQGRVDGLRQRLRRKLQVQAPEDRLLPLCRRQHDRVNDAR